MNIEPKTQEPTEAEKAVVAERARCADIIRKASFSKASNGKVWIEALRNEILAAIERG